MKRICKKCGLEKDIEEFYMNRKTRLWKCKRCIREIQSSPKNAFRRRELYKKHRKECHEECCIKAREKRNRNIISVLVGDCRRRATKKCLEFNITKYDLCLYEKCPILGIDIKLGVKNHINSPSIDRIDNNKGYVKGNVIVISYRANKLKQDATLDELWKVYYNNKMIDIGRSDWVEP